MLHDYLRDTLVLSYNKCKSGGNRTQFACIRCGYCYSCHWKKEKTERDLVEPLVMSKKYSQPAIIEQSHLQRLISRNQQQEQTKIIYVYGQQTEPICNYHTCHHKFSLHGYSIHVCKCRHPLNYATGVPISISQINNTSRDLLHKKWEEVLEHYH
jgi:hypothetical protein